jgi:hypothetical protein
MESDKPTVVIPGRPEGPNPEPIFQRPVFLGSGLAAARRPGMTLERAHRMFDRQHERAIR